LRGDGKDHTVWQGKPAGLGDAVFTSQLIFNRTTFDGYGSFAIVPKEGNWLSK
jgi:UTP-glucose-1-phosphate uridylyltransferase